MDIVLNFHAFWRLTRSGSVSSQSVFYKDLTQAKVSKESTRKHVANVQMPGVGQET
jgi:hypothetical protein